MRNRVLGFLLVYIGFVSLANIAAYSINETRPDIYIMLNILAYYVSLLLVEPKTSKTGFLKALNISLLALFIGLIGYRVYMVINGV